MRSDAHDEKKSHLVLEPLYAFGVSLVRVHPLFVRIETIPLTSSGITGQLGEQLIEALGLRPVCCIQDHSFGRPIVIFATLDLRPGRQAQSRDCRRSGFDSPTMLSCIRTDDLDVHVSTCVQATRSHSRLVNSIGLQNQRLR